MKVIPIATAQDLPHAPHSVQARHSVSSSNLTAIRLTALPPLTLYVHVPWCVRKCPYCDFNSHQRPDFIPEQHYLQALQADLEQVLPQIWGRQVHAIFIGGGTPSLLSAHAIDRMLAMFRSHLSLWPDAEITLEANPGTAESARFQAYAASGINRISLGIQSFDDDALTRLGRIHCASQACEAIEMAQQAVKRVNLDLMFALPGQSLDACIADARQVLSFGTEHVSLYQLTIEPQTVFAKFPPTLPDGDLAGEMEDAIVALAQEAGLDRYEVSAFSKPGARSRHNLNYWEFGDYIGIGPGAHSKISFPDRIVRQARTRNPDAWMQASLLHNQSQIAETRSLKPEELPFEFMLNALRLREGVPCSLYNDRCGLSTASMANALNKATRQGLLSSDPTRFAATPQGWRFLNELQSLFL